MMSITAIGRPQSIPMAALRENRWMVGLVLLHMASMFLFAAAFDLPFPKEVLKTVANVLTLLLPVAAFVLLLWRVIHMVLAVRPARPLLWVLKDIRTIVAGGETPYSGVVAFAAFTLFCSSFAYFKAVLPLLNPFSWDQLFADLDAALLGGQDAYTLLLPLFGHPYIVTVINGFYHAWALLLYFILFLACFSRSQMHARNTFLFAFILTWVVGGNLLATVFSSGGPVYYELLGYGDRFAPLMQKLAASHEISPVMALDVQAMLWRGYIGEGPFMGISALPSMHVASTMVLTLYAFTYARWAGVVMTVFALIIVIGSVLLGWHYLVDGIAGAAIAVLCWLLARRLTAPHGSTM